MQQFMLLLSLVLVWYVYTAGFVLAGLRFTHQHLMLIHWVMMFVCACCVHWHSCMLQDVVS